MPVLRVDGISRYDGAPSCAEVTGAYTSMIDHRLSETGGMSPVDMSAAMSYGSGTVTVTAHCRLVDPATLTNLRATILLYEDNVEWCCGYDGAHTWQGVTRRIIDQNITLTNVGDDALVAETIPLDAGWNVSQLHAAVYLQKTDTKEIIQGFLVRDYAVDFAAHVDSAPTGDRLVTFRGTIQNLLATSANFTIAIGLPFGNWPTEFLVCDDAAPHTEPLRMQLAPGEACEVVFRAVTDASHGVRPGALQVTCEANARRETETFRIFNGSPAILLVDNDGHPTYQNSLVNALNRNGYLFEDWDADALDSTPAIGNMTGFDIVIWHTAGRSNADCLSAEDVANLMRFMDLGGSIFVTSNYYLNSLGGGTNPFLQGCLGVASYVVDTGYTEMTGVTGDPIGDRIALPLHFQFPQWALGDDAVPGPSAATDFLAPDGSHAMIRNTMEDGSKSVFMPERFDAVSATDPDPNNATTLIHRIVEWVKPTASDVDDRLSSHRMSGIVQAQPNPFATGTGISFVLSEATAASPVRLEIIDIGGRIVAAVVDGVLTPGVHVARWNGRSGDGANARSGVYFARLTTREGAWSSKLILVK